MTKQRTATPEQWADAGAFASGTRACLDELRARIEALEATQQPNSSASLTSSPAGSLVERIGSAAILEVAAAALQMHPDKNLTWERVALWLEQEANQ